MTDHTHLRELAQKATPGPWTLEYDSDSGEYGENYGQWPHALNGPKSKTEWNDPERQEQYGHHVSEISDMSDADAEFIAAANPTVVLALLDEIATLVTQVRNQAAELEDTRAAYQLTRHQLDAHRAGQGTYGGSYSYQDGPIEPGPLTTEELAQTEDD